MLRRRPWAALSAAMLSGTMWITGAFGAPPPAAATAPSSTSAPPPAPAAPSPVEVATQRFLAGQSQYEKAKYDLALAEFQASYDAVKSPNSRLYIARCIRKLGRKKDAYNEYVQVVAEAEKRAAEEAKYAGTLSAAKEERDEMKKEIAVLRLLMPGDVKDAAVRVGNESIAPERLSDEIAVDTGQVTVSIEAKGRKPFTKTLEFKAGDDRKVAVELPVDEEAAEGNKNKIPFRTYAYISGGVGAAGLALWGIFGVMASNRYDDLFSKCQGRCGSSFQDEVDAGRTETGVSNAGLVIGILGIAGGVGLFTWDLMANKKKTEAGEAPKTVSLQRAGVQLGPQSGMVTVGGVF